MHLSNTSFFLVMVYLNVWMTVSCSERTNQDGRQDIESERSSGPINAFMSQHFDQVTSIQRALVRGDLDEAHALSRWLAEQPTLERLPEGWDPFVLEIKTAARLTSEARTYKAAAAATAAMVKTCAACHRATDVKPPIPELGMKGLPPAEHIEKVPQMLQHQWAMEKMWVGLINPSDASWREGAEVLAGAPLKPQTIPDDTALLEEVEALAEAVHEVGRKAIEVDDWNERSLFYGELLATCAECHRKLGLSTEEK